MAIGTSLGAFHENEFRMASAPWFIDPKMEDSDNNVIDPDLDTGPKNILDNPVINVANKPPLGESSDVADVDLTEHNNTPMEMGDEAKYSKWLRQNSVRMGRDLDTDRFDYDIQGYWKDNPDSVLDKGSHLPDTYKKPNHPTFSNESNWHGQDFMFQNEDGSVEPEVRKFEGGTWAKDDKGKDTFTPGRTNFEFRSAAQMLEYFKKHEPNAKLILPSQ